MMLVIDVNGAHNVRKAYPDASLLFLMPPSLDALRERIARRGSTNDIEKRMEIARKEMEDSVNFDFVIVNDDLDRCVREVSDVIDSRTVENTNPEE